MCTFRYKCYIVIVGLDFYPTHLSVLPEYSTQSTLTVPCLTRSCLLLLGCCDYFVKSLLYIWRTRPNCIAIYSHADVSVSLLRSCYICWPISDRKSSPVSRRTLNMRWTVRWNYQVSLDVRRRTQIAYRIRQIRQQSTKFRQNIYEQKKHERNSKYMQIGSTAAAGASASLRIDVSSLAVTSQAEVYGFMNAIRSSVPRMKTAQHKASFDICSRRR